MYFKNMININDIKIIFFKSGEMSTSTGKLDVIQDMAVVPIIAKIGH